MKIRPRKLPSGNVVYQLDFGLVNGKRRQVNYPNEKAAKTAYDQELAKQKKMGELAGMLNAVQVADAVQALKTLEGLATLQQAAHYYVSKHQAVQAVLGIEELMEEFISHREFGTEGYFKQIRVSMRSLARAYPAKKAHEISKEDVLKWMRGQGWSKKTRNNNRSNLLSVFSWALEQKIVAENPCVEIGKVREDDSIIETLTVEQCKALLDEALVYHRQGDDRRIMLGYVVLALFTGIRPKEVERLDWSAVNLEEKLVVVAGMHAKSRRRRVIDLADNAVEWLKQLSDEERTGPVCAEKHFWQWRTFRRRAGFAVEVLDKKRVRWPRNGLRHTYASMHYAMHQNEALLQAQMGHDDNELLHRNYRALKTKGEAEKFWALRPGGLKNAIVPA